MRIVIKVGTSTLAHPTGRLNIQRIELLCKVMSDLKNAGHQIILVSSGAIAMGFGKLNLPERPKDVPTKQASAAVGQCELMYTYDKLFTEYNHTVAQLLITRPDIAGAVPVELRLDQRAAAIIPGTPASETDFDTEFLDYILAVGVVDSVDEAVAHVLRHSTGHSDAIITENAENAQKFVDGTDSAAVYVNVSTRFTDGGEFGLGCEMGISTQKLHARGPMGLDELCTYKYIIRGNGQTR